jgi:hypothetical protein
VPDSLVVREYAALSFLSPAGLRHFLPAYLSWALRHPDSPQAAYDSTVWSLLPEYDRGRLDALTPAEVEAVIAFLRAVEHPDAARALAYWRGRRA